MSNWRVRGGRATSHRENFIELTTWDWLIDFLARQFRVSPNRGQQVVEIVRDTGDQPTHCVQLLYLPNLFL
jgi:hypothetical protein